MGDINANLALYFLRLDKETTEGLAKEINWRDEPFYPDDLSEDNIPRRILLNSRLCEIIQECVTEVLEVLKPYTKGLYHKFYWLDMPTHTQT